MFPHLECVWKTPSSCVGCDMSKVVIGGKPMRDNAFISANLLVSGVTHTEQGEIHDCNHNYIRLVSF